MLKEVKNILFDLGGVLFHLDYNKTINEFIKLGATHFETIFTQHQQQELFNNFETGKVDSTCFINELQKEIPACSERELINAWNAMLLGMPYENLKLLQTIQGRYRLFLLSNANTLHISEVNRQLKNTFNINDLDNLFEKAYYSHKIGKRKPHVETFNWVIEDANIKAEETLFIEDSIQHIEGAKKAGLQTLHLKTNDSITSFFLDKAQ